jgi:hypothetical protein
MKVEVAKVRLVLHLDVVTNNPWREMAPFREAVLAHFADPALRAELVALSEAVADQVLERKREEAPADREPWPIELLRAVLVDFRHSLESLKGTVALLEEGDPIPNGKRLSRHSATLTEGLDRDLRKLEKDLGPSPPSAQPAKAQGNNQKRRKGKGQ